MGFHSWLYHHAHWLYKWLSSYAYEMNCEIQEICEEITQTVRNWEEQQKINEIIQKKAYQEAS